MDSQRLCGKARGSPVLIRKMLAASMVGCALSVVVWSGAFAAGDQAQGAFDGIGQQLQPRQQNNTNAGATAEEVSLEPLRQQADALAAEIGGRQGNVVGTTKELAKLAEMARVVAQLQDNIAAASPQGDPGEVAFLTEELASLQAQFATLAPSLVRNPLYAAPAGSGTECSQAVPCSLTGAQAAVRVAVAKKTGASMTVLLADGTYRVANTWRFGPLDSGAAGNPVVWKPAEGAKPVISGGTKITGWTIADQAKGIWSANVPANAESRQLYINGRTAQIARATPAELGFRGGWRGSATGYTFSSDANASTWFGALTAAQAAKVEFNYFGKNGPWTNGRCRVASASTAGITMTQPCWKNMTGRASFRDASGGLPSMSTSTVPDWIENAYSLLRPGQWFLDEDADKLFYIPVEGQDVTSLDFELPKLEQLVTIAGSLANPVHDITFEGIQFSHATWNGPSKPTGLADVQSNLHMTGQNNQGMCEFSSPAGSCPFGAITQPKTNVTISAARNIVMTGNRFVNLGGAALGIVYGSANTRIQGNEFTDIASAGVFIGCTYDPTPGPTYAQAIKTNCTPNPSELTADTIGRNEILTGTTISDNLVHDIGVDYMSASAITLLFSQDTKITQNHIYDVPYTAITAGVIQGHVDDPRHPQNSTNINARITISYNLVHNHMNRLQDGGSVYLEGHQAEYIYGPNGVLDPIQTIANGALVLGNVTHTFGSNFSYYDDAGAEWITFDRNVQFNSFPDFPHRANGGCNPTGHFWITGNYVSGTYKAYECDTRPVDINFAADNKTIPNQAGVNDVPSDMLAKAGLTAPYRRLENAQPATVRYVSPPAAGKVLVGGFGFKPDTRVTFGGREATAIEFLSPGFLIATVPDGAMTPAFASEPTVGRIDDHSPAIVYTGNWRVNGHRLFPDVATSIRYTSTNGDSVDFSFSGTGIDVMGELNQDQGNLGVSLDGGAEVIVNTAPASPLRAANIAVFSKRGLARGNHTIRVTKRSGTNATFDGFNIIP